MATGRVSTWGELKRLVDQEFKAAGVTDGDSTPIDHIQVDGVMSVLDVVLDEDGIWVG